MNFVKFALLWLGALAALSLAAPSQPLPPAALSAMAQPLLAAIESSSPSLLEAALSGEALKILAPASLSRGAADKLCEQFKSSLKSAAAASTVLAVVRAQQALDCATGPVGSKTSALLRGVLTSVEGSDAEVADVAELHAAVAAFRLLRKQSRVAADATLPFDQVLAHVESLVDSYDATILPRPGASRGTLADTGRALSLAADIDSLTTLPARLETFAIVLAENGDTLLLEGQTELDVGGVAFIDHGNSASAFVTTFELLSGNIALQGISGFEIEDSLIVDVAEYLTNFAARAHTIQEIYYFAKTLSLYQQGGVFYANHSPVVMSIAKSSVSLSNRSGGGVIVKVTDLFGNVLSGNNDDINVHLHSANDYHTNKLLASNQLLLSRDNNEYEFNIFAAKPEVGFYTLELSVQFVDQQLQKQYLTQPIRRVVKVVSAISLSTVEMQIVDTADPDVSNRFSANYPNQITQELRTQMYYTLKFKVQVKSMNRPTRVQQAFVRLSAVFGTEIEAIFAAELENSYYVITIDLAEHGKLLEYHSGDYSIELIIGDTFAENSFSWQLGSVHIDYAPTLRQKLLAAKEEFVNVYVSKPEIKHKFQVPAKRPSEQLSVAFTLASLAPFLLLLVILMLTRANLNNLPSGLAFINTALFCTCITSTFCLLGFYWLQLRMFDTLFYLAGISVCTLYFGKKSLYARAERRSKQKFE